MPKRREVCSMYNEVKRFYLFRRRRWADTLFDTLYHVIFILGFYSLLRGNSDFQLSYFYYYFILTHVVSLGNEELEYEIRSGQSFGTQYALQSVYRIYLQRAVVYFVWLALIFWIALLLIHQGLPTHYSLKVISLQGLLVVLIGFLIENMWTEGQPDTIYWICIGICVVLLLMYEFFTHPWYYRKMEEKQ